jgi:probable F420-dependent oxidoreductase
MHQQMTETTTRKFRFAVTGRGETLAQWQDFARKAEDLGYSTLAIGEHIDRFMAPLLALSVAAQATKHLRFGAQILINDFRHPLILAKEAATTDVLTEGRLELGIGLGSTLRDYQMAGLPIYSAGARVERIQETVAILKAFFSQETVTYEGKHYQIEGIRCYPSPVQKPHIPLMIGAAGPRMLSFAAREADIISILTERSAGPSISGSMSEKIGIVREAAGSRFDKCEIHTWYTRVQVDGEPQMGASLANSPHFGLVGSREQVIDQLLAERELNGVAYITVTGAAIDAFAPVVSRLAGT